MMELPKNSTIEENGDEMKSVPLDPEPKDPAPRPDPDPVADGGASKPAVNGAVDARDADLKDGSGGAEENSADSAAEGLRAKKSVRWSQELVMERPEPRDSDRAAGNPYENYSPAPAPDSSSFNFKGSELICALRFDIRDWVERLDLSKLDYAY